jgi:AcrR family transcriptional regulator
MGAQNARGGRPKTELRVIRPVRLAHADRREDLLDAASRLITADGVEAVSMESVADAAGVSRPLVYKHFGNRSDILVAVFRRESQLVHDEMSIEVAAAHTLEDTYRALVRASMQASAERGRLFAALRAAGAWDSELLRERQARDRRTVRFFAERATTEFGIPKAEAEAVSAMFLSAIEGVLTLYRARRTASLAGFLEEVYLDLILGGIDRLCERAGGRTAAGRR